MVSSVPTYVIGSLSLDVSGRHTMWHCSRVGVNERARGFGLMVGGRLGYGGRFGSLYCRVDHFRLQRGSC